MTARDELHAAFVSAMQDGNWHMTADEDHAKATTMIDAAIAEAIQAHDDVLHFTGRPAPAESGYARDQLIVAFRGGEEGEFNRYGWDEAVAMADRVIRSLREEIRKEQA